MDDLLTESDLRLLATAARYHWPWCIYQGTPKDCFGRLCKFSNGASVAAYSTTREEAEFWELFFTLRNLGHPLGSWYDREPEDVSVLDVLLRYVEPLQAYLETEAHKELAALSERPLAARPKLTVTPDLSPLDILVDKVVTLQQSSNRIRPRDRSEG